MGEHHQPFRSPRTLRIWERLKCWNPAGCLGFREGHGANVNLKDKQGKTPFAVALTDPGNAWIIDVLRNHGAKRW